jgi:hypothetical protein
VNNQSVKKKNFSWKEIFHYLTLIVYHDHLFVAVSLFHYDNCMVFTPVCYFFVSHHDLL